MTVPSLRDGFIGTIGVATGFAMGFISNFLLRRLRPVQILFDSDDDDISESAVTPSASSHEEHKLVFCVRTDLKMQKGKIAAQVGHATLGAYKKAARRDPMSVSHWERHAQPKIALQIRSQHEAQQLEKKASRLGLVTYVVYDAGRTQIAAVRQQTTSIKTKQGKPIENGTVY